jgi:hypothetical protein
MSRLTFREPAGKVAWQKQLRDRYLSEGVPPVPHLSVKRAIVKPVTRKMAEQVILKYEWLGRMATTGYHYGIFFGPFCAGVTCYAAGGGTGGVNSHRPFRIARSELAVLARGACVHWAPPGANSKLVSISSKLFANDTNCRIVIAYADGDAGEIGTIYQACNWTYIGRGAATRQWLAPNGRIYDQKLPYDLNRRNGFHRTRAAYVEALRDDGWREQDSNPKGRYVRVLHKHDRQLAALVESMRQPYPKRIDVLPADGSGSGDQPCASPTRNE